jgi:hypothetical protein
MLLGRRSAAIVRETRICRQRVTAWGGPRGFTRAEPKGAEPAHTGFLSGALGETLG